MATNIVLVVLILFNLYQYFVIVAITNSLGYLREWVAAVTNFTTSTSKELTKHHNEIEKLKNPNQ